MRDISQPTAQAQAGSNRLAVLAHEINSAHTEARQYARKSLERAIAAGDGLIEAKVQLKHGEWLPWLRGKCEIPERTAQLYMRLAKHKDELLRKSDNLADLTVQAALALLTEKTTLAEHAERINQLWAVWQENLHELRNTISELRQSFQDQGGDEAFRVWWAARFDSPAENILYLLDEGDDEAWTGAMLTALEASFAAAGAP